MGYVGAGIFGGAQLAAQAAAAPAPIRLQPTVITVSPPNPGAGSAVANLQGAATGGATNYVAAPAPKNNTMLYLAGAALLAGVFLMKR